jgi:hypothetical protein
VREAQGAVHAARSVRELVERELESIRGQIDALKETVGQLQTTVETGFAQGSEWESALREAVQTEASLLIEALRVESKPAVPEQSSEVGPLPALARTARASGNQLGNTSLGADGTASTLNDTPEYSLLGANEDLQCMNVHAFCIVYGTKHSANFCASVSSMFFSMAFILVQVALLASVILESSFSRCTAHDQCNLGEWCSPALGGDFTTTPGVCFDCWSAKMFYEARFENASYETSPDPYELMGEAAGDKWLREGARHCLDTDRMPDRCDHVVHTLSRISPLNMLVFFVMAVLVVSTILEDIDDVADLELLTWHRSRFLPSNLKPRWYIIKCLAWLGFVFRKWVLPMLIIGASSALLLLEELTSRTLLLNGIAVTFVTTMDDTLGWMFFRSFSGEGRPRLPVPILIWIYHRLYAMSLVAVLMYTVINSEELLSIYGNEKKYGSVCSDLREIVTVFSANVCIGFAIIHAPLNYIQRWIDRDSGRRASYYKKDFMNLYSGMLPFFRLESWYWLASATGFIINLIVPALLVYVLRNAFVAQGPLVMLQVARSMVAVDPPTRP